MEILDNRPRLESLDILRGLTIAGMILVNNPGNWQNTWPILKHAEWDGLSLADLLFPFFLVVMGVSTALSVNNQLEKDKPKSVILRLVIGLNPLLHETFSKNSWTKFLRFCMSIPCLGPLFWFLFLLVLDGSYTKRRFL